MSKKTIEEFVAEEKKQQPNTEYDLATIKDYLPKLYLKTMSIYNTDEKKSIALFSSIVGVSSILGDYSIFYNNEHYNANLFGFVMGNAGSGKTVMRVVEKILLGIKSEKQREWKEALELLESQKQNGGDTLVKPKRTTLYIPASTSGNNLCRLLKENDGCGLIFETEADALSVALEGRSIGYRDLLRNCFDNQKIGLSYKNDHSLIEVDNPKLSILTSGTPKQFLRLFRSAEDGLLSRFLIFKVRSSNKFSIRTNSMDVSEKISKNVSQQLLELHHELKDAGSIYFSYSTAQIKQCEQIFQELLDSTRETYDDVLDGVVFRYGLIFWKVAMQISLVETFEESKKLPSVIECTEKAFEFAQHFILEHLSSFIDCYEQFFQKKEIGKQRSDNLRTRADEQDKVWHLHLAGHSYSQILKLTMFDSKQTISKIVNERLRLQTQTAEK